MMQEFSQSLVQCQEGQILPPKGTSTKASLSLANSKLGAQTLMGMTPLKLKHFGNNLYETNNS